MRPLRDAGAQLPHGPSATKDAGETILLYIMDLFPVQCTLPLTLV